MTDRKHVVVAMSGGVDSSVAAALLHEAGHRVIGVTLRLLKVETGFGCCGSSRDIEDARAVCAALGVPHYVMDFADDFKTTVRDPFVQSYLAGETPNPCVACNRFIKFDALLNKAVALGADHVATGHYARLSAEGPAEAPVYRLARARDEKKDQSYVLHHLAQPQLSRLLFPLGELTKAEVRDVARRAKIRTADKEESMEICFVPGRDAAGYVKAAAPAAPTAKPGPLVDTAGRLVGTHKGAAFYTRGQREGLGGTFGRPVYVVDIDPATNTVVIGSDQDTRSRRFRVEDLVWTAGRAPGDEFAATVQIRAHAAAAPCVVRLSPDGAAEVEAPEGLRAVTPGQSAVFYDGDRVVGGGTIRRTPAAAAA
jgi:tRNA-specific 2-thiouridylase